MLWLGRIGMRLHVGVGLVGRVEGLDWLADGYILRVVVDLDALLLLKILIVSFHELVLKMIISIALMACVYAISNKIKRTDW